MFFMYFAVWMIFAGDVTLEICLFGIAIAAIVFWFTCKFMDYSIEKEKKNVRKVFRFLGYIAVLIKEILMANLQAIRLILSEKEEVRPVLVHFETDIKTEAGKVLLANSITLTPGTITVELEDSGYVVHCLDEKLAPGMDQSVFVNAIRDIEE